jgi:hypothetical protein
LNLSVLGGFDHASVEGCAVTVKVSGMNPFPGTALDELRKLNCDMMVEDSMKAGGYSVKIRLQEISGILGV